MNIQTELLISRVSEHKTLDINLILGLMAVETKILLKDSFHDYDKNHGRNYYFKKINHLY